MTPIRALAAGTTTDKIFDMLRHQHYQGGLAEQGRLSGHIRSGEDDDLAAVVAHRQVVGHIFAAGLHHSLDDGMAAGLYFDVERVVDSGAAVVVLGGKECEAGKAVYLGHELRVALYCGHILLDLRHKLAVDAGLDGQDAFLCTHYGLLVFLQLRGDVALGIDEGLLADPVLRHLVGVGVAHFEVIAEDVVVTYLEAADAGAFAFGLLDVQQYLFAVRQRVAEVVELAVHPFGDDVALTQLGRSLRSDGVLYKVAQGAAAVHPGAQGRHFFKLAGEGDDLRYPAQAVGKGKHLPRADAAHCSLRNHPLEVAYVGEGGAD